MVTADPQGDDTECWWRLSSSLAVPTGLLRIGGGVEVGDSCPSPCPGEGLHPAVPAGGQETDNLSPRHQG